jgi:NAD/NADP transhydrogenase alpha subunit
LAQSLALWIDVEGAEFMVLEGIREIRDRVVAVHVETANHETRIGLRAIKDLDELMESFDFVRVGRNFGRQAAWGDAVYVSAGVLARNLWQMRMWQAKACVARQVPRYLMTALLRKPRLFRGLKKLLRT